MRCWKGRGGGSERRVRAKNACPSWLARMRTHLPPLVKFPGFFCFLAFVLFTWGSGGWAFKLHKINPEVTKPNYSKQIKLVKLLKRLEKPDQTIDIAPFKIRLSSDMRHVSHECASNDRVVKRTALFSDVPQGLKDYRMILCTAGFLKRESY